MKSSRARRTVSRTRRRSGIGSRRASTRSRRTSGSTTTAPRARTPERPSAEAEGPLSRLRHALQALALPAEQQLRLLPSFVPELDELALAFDHGLAIARGSTAVRLTRAQQTALRSVEDLLDGMSGQALAHLWTRAAIADGEAWSRLRRAASIALRSFGWKAEVPTGILFEYIEW